MSPGVSESIAYCFRTDLHFADILDNSRSQHIYLHLLEDNNMDALHTLGVYPMRHQFWQYPHANVYHVRQPDELHQLLLRLVKDLLHWVLKYLTAWNVKNQFDNWFRLVSQYPCLYHFSKPFNSLKAAPGKVKKSMERSEHWQWIALQLLTAPKMSEKLWQKIPVMK